MIDENWVNFTRTGNILEYIKYKQNEQNLRADYDTKNNEGFSNKRTDNRGE